MQLTAKFIGDYAGLFDHVPHLPREELARHYREACALVFPSSSDGFGLVITEALSAGLPVVASTHTGAPGFITPGREGLLYPFGDDDGLCAALDQILSRPEQAAEIGKAAYQLATRWTWRHYRQKFIGLIMQLLEAPVRPRGEISTSEREFTADILLGSQDEGLSILSTGLPRLNLE
jgi:glycosyltransferase involved in cell wall biosynthesis